MSPVVRVTTEAGIEVRDCFRSLAYILVLRKQTNKKNVINFLNPLQYSCLGNSMDRGNWRGTVHGSQDSDMME